MNGKASHIGVIEVEVAASGTIGKGRKVRRRAPAGTDNGRVTADRKRDVAANPDRFFVEGADTASDRIDNMRLDPLNGRSIEIVIAHAIGICGQSFGKRANGRLRRLPCGTALGVRNPRSGRERGSTCGQM
jgi:hypothetical protein